MHEGKSEYPADVMALAEETCRQNEYSPKNFDGTPSTVCLTICKAILSERQRDLWQPIDAAPKDGTDILVCDARVQGGHMNVVSYTDEDYPNVWETQEFLAYHKDMFTHWQPLPSPPSSTEER